LIVRRTLWDQRLTAIALRVYATSMSHRIFEVVRLAAMVWPFGASLILIIFLRT
jgi:hypothetical protein